MEDSKGISYDGVIRSAYWTYQDQGSRAELHQKVDDYLERKFSRSPQYRAVFVNFWDEKANTDVYLMNGSVTGYSLLLECRNQSRKIHEIMEPADTDIRTIILNGNLYMARNLLNSQFKPYATVVLMLEPKVIFASMNGLTRLQGSQFCIDGEAFFLGKGGNVLEQEPVPLDTADIRYSVEEDGHRFSFSADYTEYSLLKENPWLLLLGITVGLMVLPLVVAVIALFRQHITLPADILGDANQTVEAGNRGFRITQEAPNAEFSKLFSQFNAMSEELKNQFERAYLEQQATQKAQIKALQSQINPHFLNKTLEVINWEARLSGNEHVSEMIEALSTMLGAALDRKGNTQIPLQEELGYVDAYLKIIQWRVGDGFHVYKEILPETLPLSVPRLILQPIVENAVEHDITSHHGGNLWVRTFLREEMFVVEVEHDGTLSPEDRENIRHFLQAQTAGSHVGLQNVAQLCFPMKKPEHTERNLTQ